MTDQQYKAEFRAITARRKQPLEPEGSEKPQAQAIANLTGLACSGGGIRSATFCLGVAQAIYKKGPGILPEVDYLSTVSGGGYFGAFLSSYLNHAARDEVGLEPDRLPFAEHNRVEPTPVRMLRNNSKYLLKGGLLGQARMAGLLLFGILVNLMVLLPVLFVALTISTLIQYYDLSELISQGAWAVLRGLSWLLAAVVFGLPLVYHKWALQRQRIAKYERVALVVAILTLAAWLLGQGMPLLYEALNSLLGSSQAVIGLFLGLPFLFAALAFSFGADRLPGRLLITLTGIAGPLLLVMSFFALQERITISGWSAVVLLGISLLLVTWLSLINVNQISPHRYYRNRLAETYLLRRREGDTRSVDPQPLSNLRSENSTAPYHLINAAVNLPGSKQAELRGRRSDFFLFSQDYCGSPLLGYCPTRELERKDACLDLGTAMSVSGAAASSFMGTQTIRSLTFWLSLLNVRLAYWLPNPGRIGEIKNGAFVRPWSLWREFSGSLSERDNFVNLSDGGHIENLGIYELLRRRCKFIIAIDGEADPRMEFPSLMQLIRYAQIDLGIQIQVDLNDLAKNEAGYSRAHFVFGTIEYGPGQTGYLLYIKSSITGNEQDYVLSYRQRNPSFPHESTADQFFSEAQFEAYRALGEHIGGELFQEEHLPTGKALNLQNWFERLARNLL